MSNTQVLDLYSVHLQASFITNEAGTKDIHAIMITAQNVATTAYLGLKIHLPSLREALSQAFGFDAQYIDAVIEDLKMGACVELGGRQTQLLADPLQLIKLGFSPTKFS